MHLLHTQKIGSQQPKSPFTKLERAVISASGSKYPSVVLSDGQASFSRAATRFIKAEDEWDKPNTPFRLTLSKCASWEKLISLINIKTSSGIQFADQATSGKNTQLHSKDNSRASQHAGSVKKSMNRMKSSFVTVGKAESSLPSAPVTTVIVKWQLRAGVTPYTRRDILTLLRRFGRIQLVELREVNRALVVFKEVEGAHQAVACADIGVPKCRVVCQWFYPLMANLNLQAIIKHQPIHVDVQQID